METALAQMAKRGIDRRTLLRMAAVGGVGVAVRPFRAFAQALSGAFGAEPSGGPAWETSPGVAGRRIEGFAKVAGRKLFAADFRAADMPGWPAETGHALLVKTADATHVFEGIDLDLLTPEFRPDRVVLAADLGAAGITVPGFYAGDLLCPAGKTPLYLGQPVALLIWKDFARFSVARGVIAARPDFVKTGAETAPVDEEPYGAYHFVRLAGATADSDDVYSAFQAGWARPVRYIKNRPQWAAPAQSGSVSEETSFYGDRVRAAIDNAGDDALVLDRSLQTQSVDQVFLEPESALGWYDPGNGRLELVVGVQSPYWIASNIAALVAKNTAAFAVRDVVANCAYVGGGFGGRDFSIFPLFAALAALFSPGQPIRLANNRYRPVPTRPQAACLRHPQSHRRRQGERQDRRLCLRPGSRRRRPRQPVRRRGPGRRRRHCRQLRCAQG